MVFGFKFLVMVLICCFSVFIVSGYILWMLSVFWVVIVVIVDILKILSF